MDQPKTADLEARLANRPLLPMPADLRHRILDCIKRGLHEAPRPLGVGVQLVAVAAALMLTLNLLLAPSGQCEPILGDVQHIDVLPESNVLPPELRALISEEELRRQLFLHRTLRQSIEVPLSMQDLHLNMSPRGS